MRVPPRLSGTGRWVEVRSLCEGGELYDRIAEEGVLEPQEAFSLFEQVVRAVEHSHACGVAPASCGRSMSCSVAMRPSSSSDSCSRVPRAARAAACRP